MSFLSSHLGDDTMSASGPASGPIDASAVGPSPAVLPLNTVTDVMPTNSPYPLATSDAQPVPMTPASPMQANAPAPLAVMDPNQYVDPASVITVVPTPAASTNTKIMMAVGLGIVALAFFAKGRK